MECPACGAQLVNQAQYCHHCGAAMGTSPRDRSQNDPSRPASAGSEAGGSEAGGSEAGGSEAGGSEAVIQRALAGRRAGADAPERPLWQGSFSALGMIHNWILAGILSVGTLVVWFLQLLEPPWGLWLFLASLLYWLWLLLVLGYRKLSVRYELSDQRLLHYHGLLHRHAERIELIDIEDIGFDQSIVQRIVDVGRITITSSDRSHPQMALVGIDRVAEVCSLIDDARRQERIRRGIYVESI